MQLKNVLVGGLTALALGCSSGGMVDEPGQKEQQQLAQFHFAQPKPFLTQLDRLEPDSRGCVLDRLDELGVLGAVENASEDGSRPVLASQLPTQTVQCGDLEVEFGFNYDVPLADGSVQVRGLWAKIKALFTDAYDKVCVEIVCICANPITGGKVTCGCPSSDVPSCESSGFPSGCPNDPGTCIDDGPEGY